MLLKLIACEVFTREVCHCVARSPHVVDLEFTPKDAHNDSAVLRALLEEKIAATHASERDYDAILLCLGVCGNSTVGLKSLGAPLVLPRAHDCCTLFLGSRKRFEEHFREHPSTPFSAAGYVDHGGDVMHAGDGTMQDTGLGESYADYVDKYGEDNARYIWDTIHPPQVPGSETRVVFIEVPGIADADHVQACRKRAEDEGKEFVCLKGSMDLIRKLVFGEWDDEEFQVVQQGQIIASAYDWDRIVRAEDNPTDA